MSELPDMNHQHPPSGGDNVADVLPFKARIGEDEVDPNDLSPAECVSFFVYRWNHPSFSDDNIADVINTDASYGDKSDVWKKRLQEVVIDSPLFDDYEGILKADAVTHLLDSAMRSTLPARGSMSDERKALSTLMYMRASEVVVEPEKPGGPQLRRQLPLGDEDKWHNLIKRLCGEQ